MPNLAQAPTQAASAYRRKLGECQLTALLDGYVELSNAVWQGVEPAEIDRTLQAHHLPRGGVRNGITAYLINTERKLIMVDAGAAGLFGPHANAFPANLASAGVDPADIDEVLITHPHPDHIGALLSHGAPALPNAVLRLSEADLAFWTDDEQRQKAPEWMRDWFGVVQSVVTAHGDRVVPFKAGQTLGSGITAVPLPGHTPGHTGFLLESAGESLLLWGDLAVSVAIQFAHPHASMVFDTDGQIGRESRLRCFDRAVADDLLTAGTHLPFPTFGYVTRHNGAFRWTADEWRYDPLNKPFDPVA